MISGSPFTHLTATSGSPGDETENSRHKQDAAKTPKEVVEPPATTNPPC